MKTRPVATWIDPGLIRWLRKLGARQAHAPTLTQVAAMAIEAGLDDLARNEPKRVQYSATPGGTRRTFSFRVSPRLHQRVVELAESRSDASTVSAVLNLLLWTGVNRLLGGGDEALHAA